MSLTRLLAFVALGCTAAAMALAGWLLARPEPVSRHDMMGFEQLSPAGLATESYRFVPLMLGEIYAAFGETDEGAIYDGLARVAAGDALERLYLERAGAMADGGLETDQQIHEIALLNLQAAPAGDGTVTLDARWRVLGTVGHAEHMHMRGNAYAADLVMAPVAGAWKLTGFTLRDVDRTGAGTLESHAEPDGTAAATQ